MKAVWASVGGNWSGEIKWDRGLTSTFVCCVVTGIWTGTIQCLHDRRYPAQPIFRGELCLCEENKQLQST